MPGERSVVEATQHRTGLVNEASVPLATEALDVFDASLGMRE
jgi:hypothetical protein